MNRYRHIDKQKEKQDIGWMGSERERKGAETDKQRKRLSESGLSKRRQKEER